MLPAVFEALLIVHRKVEDVSVIGSPDVDAGELPKADVVAELDRNSPRTS